MYFVLMQFNVITNSIVIQLWITSMGKGRLECLLQVVYQIVTEILLTFDLH